MVNAAKVEAGNTYGRLTVSRYAGKERYGQSAWVCRCECGEKVTVRAKSLRNGDTRSCGCLCREFAARQGKKNRKHGGVANGCKSRTYQAWANMKARCTNPKNSHWKYYGGHETPVRVCDRWLSSFGNFVADMGECPPGLSIDRIDPYGHYEPRNCRWATPTQQANNQRPRVGAVAGNWWE